VENSWIQAIINPEQFKKIDHWLFTLLQNENQLDPLKKVDYCVVVRKRSDLNREVIFSPNCFDLLCEIQPEFLSFKTQLTTKPEATSMSDKNQFIFWFGNTYYFLKIYPPEELNF
jgi:hypothetical protein